MSSCRVTGKTLADYTYLFYGAGMAGTGIADLIADSIAKETGVPLAEARQNIWLVDTK
jgi:malate dehydrogenase (oxaloacetate-decarboxylating)(NADP+)